MEYNLRGLISQRVWWLLILLWLLWKYIRDEVMERRFIAQVLFDAN